MICRECGWRVYAFARRRSDAAAAEEIVSETFLIAWRRISDVPADALPWLLGVARNVLRHHTRADARRTKAALQHARLAAAASATDTGDRLVERDDLLAALVAMREADRETLLLIAWDGLTPSQAAGVVGCSVAAFHVRLHRARKRFASAHRSTTRPEQAPSPQPHIGAP